MSFSFWGCVVLRLRLTVILFVDETEMGMVFVTCPITLPTYLCFIFVESRHGDRGFDNHFREGECCRFLNSIYEPRNQYHDTQTRETETQCILLHGATL